MDDTRSDFIASISHQLRDPIAYTRFVLQSLLHDTTKTLSAADVDSIKKADARLSDVFALTEKLLLADKIEYVDLPLALETVSLKNLIEGIVFEAHAHIEKKNIHCEVQLAAEPDTVVADAILLKEALRNVILNAVKYSSTDGEVSIRCARDDSHITITVSDTGIGVPPDEVPLLFSKYHRLGNTQQTTGFGIGLYLAKRFIELHQGQLTYHPNQPNGSIFTITLPNSGI